MIRRPTSSVKSASGAAARITSMGATTKHTISSCSLGGEFSASAQRQNEAREKEQRAEPPPAILGCAQDVGLTGSKDCSGQQHQKNEAGPSAVEKIPSRRNHLIQVARLALVLESVDREKTE
jgi:hypothetical protein